MNQRSILLFFLTTLFVTSSFTTPNRDSFTIEFITLGNCYTCKIRIEAALNLVDGVTESNWDYSDVTTVTYDDLVTDAYIIMQAVADTGHDTEWFRAPDDAYALLINTCCEYERTIDYSQAQVGYLSLMDLWMPHVDIEELSDKDVVSVYPTLGNGVFTLKLNDNVHSNYQDIRVYSLYGSLVWTGNMRNENNIEIDITSATAGQYIICTLTDGIITSKTKISKQ